MTVPPHIWADPPETFDGTDVWRSEPGGKGVECIRADVARAELDAAVAAALEAAAKRVRGDLMIVAPDIVGQRESAESYREQCAHAVERGIPTDGKAALDKLLAAERAKFDRVVTELEGWLGIAENCDITTGYCCCGDDMRNHSNPTDCGHSPVDDGCYTASGRIKSTLSALAAIKAKP